MTFACRIPVSVKEVLPRLERKGLRKTVHMGVLQRADVVFIVTIDTPLAMRTYTPPAASSFDAAESG